MAWESRLGTLSEGLQQLNAIQRKWVYLEPIFSRGALPEQQARFRRVSPCKSRPPTWLVGLHAPIKSITCLNLSSYSHLQVDEQFRQLMAATEADSLVVRFAETPRIRVRGVKQSFAYACIPVFLHPSIWTRWALWSHSSTVMGVRCARD